LVLSFGNSQLSPDGAEIDRISKGGEVLFDEAEPGTVRHCVSHEMNTPGQGLHPSGSTGGLVLGDIVYGHEPGSSVGGPIVPLSPAQLLDQHMFPAGNGFDQPLVQDVLIVVADDFSGGYFRLPGWLFDGSSFDLAKLEAEMAGGSISHGALVMHHLNTLIAATNQFVYAPTTSSDALAIWSHSAGGSLLVYGIDLASGSGSAIDAEAVAGSIQDGVTQLHSQLADHTDFEAIVVNMSWVLLPCATVQEFLDFKGQFGSMKAYSDGLVAESGTAVTVADYEEMLNRIASVPPDHGLTMLSESREDYRIANLPTAYVAAAGNLALPYQMLPANWPQVVGVGVAPHLASPFSNAADVTVEGEWIMLTSWEGTPVAPIISYAGTSFAAPLVALYAAMDQGQQQRMTSSGQVCPAPLPLPEPDPPLVRDQFGAPYPQPSDVALAAAYTNCVQQP
jgi:hypothetical protein